MRIRRWLGGVGLALGAMLAACGGGEIGSDGPRAYYDGAASAALGAPTNDATCATCHADASGAPGYSGDPLRDIAYRSSFKGGDAPTLLAAANACIAGWMGGEPLEQSDPAWSELRAFLESISDPAVTAPQTLAPEVLADLAAYEAAYGGGDPDAGEAVYERSCAGCHDEALTVGARAAPPRAALAAYSVGRIAQKVRTSGPPPSGTAESADSTPGPMPFFEPDELSPAELRDVIAFLRAGA